MNLLTGPLSDAFVRYAEINAIQARYRGDMSWHPEMHAWYEENDAMLAKFLAEHKERFA